MPPAFYYPHDNGARSFQVAIQPAAAAGGARDVSVLRPMDSKVEITDPPYSFPENPSPYTIEVTTVQAAEVWLGGSYAFNGREAPGNTILLREAGPAGSPPSYVQIGKRVVRFTPPEPIDYYFSSIGNSDVPYPIGLSANFVWFFAPCLPRGTPRCNGPIGVPRAALAGGPYTAANLGANENFLYAQFYGINGFSKPGLQVTHGVRAEPVEVICRRPGWEEIEDRQDAYVPGDDSD
jgi:hypothetical protein